MIYLEIRCVISSQPLLRGRKCRSLALKQQQQQQQMWCIQLLAFILVVSVQCIQKHVNRTWNAAAACCVAVLLSPL